MAEQDIPTDGPANERHALQDLVAGLRDQLAIVEAQARAAREEAHRAHEEVMDLRDQVVAAERDQQDLKRFRTQMARRSFWGFLARALNRR